MAGIPRDIKDIAKALIETAQGERATAVVLRDLQIVGDVFASHPDFVRDLNESTIPLEKRQQALQHGLKEVHPFVLHALLMLQQRQLLEYVDSFVEQAVTVGRKIAKLYSAQVTTSVALSEQERADLQKTLDESFGGSHELHETVDPRILGGMIVDIGDKRYDASIKGKITRLRQAIAS